MAARVDPVFAAVDLGASSGRVIAGTVGQDRLELTEIHRFANRPVRVHGTLYWDVLALYRDILDGLRATAATMGRLDGIGVDSWGVDYGLLGADGALLSNPVHYRDGRTESIISEVHAKISAAELYATTGIGFQSFNTMYQLAAAATSPAIRAAERVLLMPDLLCYWLTGVCGTELTNASTTGLLEARTGQWSKRIGEAIGVDLDLFPPLRRPGENAGSVLPQVREQIGQQTAVPVYTVGSHDTASAVAAVPARDRHFGYVSSGTWSLVGVELDRPVLTEESREANFTNELGVDGVVRYLRNVMGLWLLQECLPVWQEQDSSIDVPGLLAHAAAAPALRSVVDATDPRFLAPGGMPSRLAQACRDTGQPEPRTPTEITRCVLDSLALAYRNAIADAGRLAGVRIDTIHVVGGGVHNELLCQLTADACGLPVEAGPAESAALGNIGVQARAAGALPHGPGALRGLLRTTQQPRQYWPRGNTRDWAATASALGYSAHASRDVGHTPI